MKRDILLTLPLAVLLAVPGVAQQTASSAPSQAAADQNLQSTSQPAEQKDQAQASPQTLPNEVHEGFWGKLNPFARKKYVKRQLDPVRGRLNELDELTAANSKAIRDVDARAQEGIRLASAKANEADVHATEAGSRAQLAHQTAQQASTRLQTVEQVVGAIDQYQTVSQTEIRFRPGQMALSGKAKTALDGMASPLGEQKGYLIEVEGFSPGSGRAALENSQHMAESVVRYLVLNHEIPVYRIFVLGMGNAPLPASTEGGQPRRTHGGRVEVTLLKNGIGDLATTASLSAPAATPRAGSPGPQSPK